MLKAGLSQASRLILFHHALHLKHKHYICNKILMKMLSTILISFSTTTPKKYTYITLWNLICLVQGCRRLKLVQPMFTLEVHHFSHSSLFYGLFWCFYLYFLSPYDSGSLNIHQSQTENQIWFKFLCLICRLYLKMKTHQCQYKILQKDPERLVTILNVDY